MKHEGFLLDTNLISEFYKKQPHAAAKNFLESSRPSSLFLSVLTFGELRRGAFIKQQKTAIDAQALARWIDDLELRFQGRVLPVDTETASLWGEFSADRTRTVVDTLLAATAARHHLTVVTRNTKDYRGLPVPVLNPWLRSGKPTRT